MRWFNELMQKLSPSGYLDVTVYHIWEGGYLIQRTNVCTYETGVKLYPVSKTAALQIPVDEPCWL